jgi:Domain of unknown function DUF29
MPRNAVAYEEDFFAWTEEQARLLRAGEFSRLDTKTSPRKWRTGAAASVANAKPAGNPDDAPPEMAISARLSLAKLGRDDRRAAVANQRTPGGITEPEDSPRPRSGEDLPTRDQQGGARYGPATKAFPTACPFSVDQMLSDDFLPDEDS